MVNTGGVQPSCGQLQLLVHSCELSVSDGCNNSKNPSDCQGSHLVWQQPKEGVQDKPASHRVWGEGARHLKNTQRILRKKREMCGRSCLKASGVVVRGNSGGVRSPSAYGNCCREAATEKSETLPEGSGQGRRSQLILASGLHLPAISGSCVSCTASAKWLLLLMCPMLNTR